MTMMTFRQYRLRTWPAVTALFLTAVMGMAAYGRPAKISPSLERSLSEAPQGESLLCWVFFGDKDGRSAYPELDSRAMGRREKVGAALGFGDLPVDRRFVDQVRGRGVKVRAVSRWLNAVSVEADASQVRALAGLTSVVRLEPVAVYRHPSEHREVRPVSAKEIPALDYGYTDEQIRLMRVNELHQKGYTGSGVRLCIIDTGFDREHEALGRARVFAERDFQRMIYDTVSTNPLVVDTLPDLVTSYQAEQDSFRVQTWHGTAMLSIIGAYKPGTLVGSAYNCDFILAKTEHHHADNEPDFYQEEDWWVAALEWADSLGADIVSSSLGYRRWSNFAPYLYREMDGATAKSSIAADSAARRGLLVVNSLGNINSNSRPDTCILAPADAKGILSVGGVWASSRQWAYTNLGNAPCSGPTADSVRVRRAGGGDSVWMRRIKPEVSSAWQASFAYNEPDSLGNYNLIRSSVGTSGACALTAGLCALLLEAHPSWGPAQVIEALKAGASNRACVEAYLTVPESLSCELGSGPAQNPAFAGLAAGHKYYTYNGATYDLYDAYRIGWGIPDGVAALNYTSPEVVLPDKDQLYDPYPNPVKWQDGGAFFPYFLTRDSYQVVLYIYSLDGRLVRSLDLGQQLAGQYPGLIDKIRQRTGSRQPAFWDLKNDRGQPVASGLYLALLSTGWGQSSRKIMVIR